MGEKLLTMAALALCVPAVAHGQQPVQVSDPPRYRIVSPALFDRIEREGQDPIQLVSQPAPATPPTAAPSVAPKLDLCQQPAVPLNLHEPPTQERMWLRAEYLRWDMNDPDAPPLVTTGDLADPVPGAIGQPGTRVIFDGSNLEYEEFNGGRITFGIWLDDCGRSALEVSAFALEDGAISALFSTADFPVLGRPFNNINQGIPFVELVGIPGVSTGTLGVTASSRLWGAEVNCRKNKCCKCDYLLDWFTGLRYLDLDEGLAIGEDIMQGPEAPTFPGGRLQVFDSFATRNHFYGGQIGAEAEFRQGRWSLNARGQLAVGVTHQTIDIEGFQIGTPAGSSTSQQFRGGLLALPSNIGHHQRDSLSFVPEVRLEVGFRVCECARVFAGYNFLYWSDVLRPGDQIDTNIDITQIPNFPVPGVQPVDLSRPRVPFKESDFWAHGVNVGLELRW